LIPDRVLLGYSEISSQNIPTDLMKNKNEDISLKGETVIRFDTILKIFPGYGARGNGEPKT
jgi:hypothetical protein